VDELAERSVKDAAVGIGGTDVLAGVFGEQPTSLGVMAQHEEKGLRAAARAHRATGLAINTHTTHGTMALEQIAVFAAQGVDLSRVVIGHMDNHPELDYVRRVLDQGVNIAFDSIGKQFWDVRLPPCSPSPCDGEYGKTAVARSDAVRADWIARLVAEGHVDQILLSQDLVGSQGGLNPQTHGL
jgi:phosphotriesterase-related protein